MNSIQVKSIESPEEILSTFPVMNQLRPDLKKEEYVTLVSSMMKEGYLLAAVLENSEICSVAGYRFGTMLARGKYLYVDDLVTDDTKRSRNFGKILFDWLVSEAKKKNCDQFHLDSGVQRYFAHRFYLRERMIISSHHFVLMLK
ncbi:GNAT family N-acetyltransferase [Leptospira sp. 201903070]|jgi:GNAT superfamily N-acetyltransferase|uniref:GNAT family N-acetyltransferase n=1 Tax=Leptospira ainlahdjerensis TaxID=2810033 RepID=A0ABS2UG05_9LEPT|nr:GNAT family N-acetyltransferase [Leptospira ainlahdjerensis]MBM9579311.1 GNAT family N-acetyltransferase [Leptospira ainlahdjerensis]